MCLPLRAARLMELRHGACDPPVANIEIKELPISTNNKEGFVACHVPESSMKPHRSEFTEKHFYLRMGDESRECNVAILRQLFYPKKTARVEATIKSVRRPNQLNLTIARGATMYNIHSAFEVSIRNIGEISMEDVQAHIECTGYKLLSYQWSNIERKFNFDFLPDIISFKASIHPTIRHAINILFASESAQNTNDIFIRVYAKDMLPRDATLPFPTNEGKSASAECLPT